jgi:hypothetical protein
VFVVWGVRVHMVLEIHYFDEAMQTHLHHMPRDVREMYWTFVDCTYRFCRYVVHGVVMQLVIVIRYGLIIMRHAGAVLCRDKNKDCELDSIW